MLYRAKMWCGAAKRKPPRYSQAEDDPLAAFIEANNCVETHAIVEKQFEPGDPGAGSPEDPTCNCGRWFLSVILK